MYQQVGVQRNGNQAMIGVRSKWLGGRYEGGGALTHLRRNVTDQPGRTDALTGRDRPFSSMVQEECSSFWAGLGLYCTIWARPSDGRLRLGQ